MQYMQAAMLVLQFTVGYSTIPPLLARAGITFQPLVWSTEGRPHPATTRVLECALKAIGRKRGADKMAEIRARWMHEIAVELQRRKAAMMRACLPLRAARETWLLEGSLQHASAAEGKAAQLPPLVVDDNEERWTE